MNVIIAEKRVAFVAVIFAISERESKRVKEGLMTLIQAVGLQL